MKAWLFSWVRMLIVCTVCMQLILLFVTEEEYRKYIRMFLSMLFLLVLFRPLLSLGDLSDRLQDELSDWSAKWEYKEPAAGRIYDTPQEDALVTKAVQLKLKEDMEDLLSEEGMELAKLDSDIRLGENDAAITQLSVTAVFAGDTTGSPSMAEETLKKRLIKRYELDEGQVYVSVRQ